MVPVLNAMIFTYTISTLVMMGNIGPQMTGLAAVARLLLQAHPQTSLSYTQKKNPMSQVNYEFQTP
jgi:hypothetical protein